MNDDSKISEDELPTALILGASRGLGLGLAEEYLRRGWRVIATVRADADAASFAGLPPEFRNRLRIEKVDINLPQTVAALRDGLQSKSLDLLFINAGVSRGARDYSSSIATEDFIDLMVTNALSPMRTLTALLPAVRERGTIAVMSSDMASVANNRAGDWEVYRASKAALNMLMRSFIVRQADGSRTYLCISPGWVRTDMGGESAPLDVGTSVAGIAATIEARTGTGGIHYLNYRNEDIRW